MQFPRAPRRGAMPIPSLAAFAILVAVALAVPSASFAQRPVPRATGGGIEEDAATITVTARQTGPTEITVRWTRVRGARSYFIGRHAPPGGWQRLRPSDASATTYVDRDVELGRSYTYQISAIGVSGSAGRRFASDSVRVVEGIVASGGDDPALEEEAPETREEMVERVYFEGRDRHARWWVKGERQAKRYWLATADVSGLGAEELLSSWKEIATAAQLYQHIFRRPPDQLELRRQLAAQRSGKSWEVQWRELAQSAQREKEHGAFAPSPMSFAQARGLFGFRNNKVGEQCFGGVGPGCNGTVPEIYAWVQPRWHDYFTLPDGTEMAYVELGVAVGSILHDNACLDGPQGQGIACQGWEAITDITKHSGVPAAMEWNKAAWNVMEERGWRVRFGPYPVDAAARRGWYDDLRPIRARRSQMANVAGVFTLPIHDQPYKGRERRASHVLEAPRGTTLDAVDVTFCESDHFSREESPIGRARLGVCR